jgi:hypothetical protein
MVWVVSLCGRRYVQNTNRYPILAIFHETAREKRRKNPNGRKHRSLT